MQTLDPNARDARYTGEFRPWPVFTSEHYLVIDGIERDDYRLEYDDEGVVLYVDGLTYDQLCNAEIRRRVTHRWGT
jgi:hypothetical protein